MLQAATLPAATTTWRPQEPVDVRRTLAGLRRGAGDPTMRLEPDGSLWRTVVGASYRLVQRGPREVLCEAWGPAAEEVVAGVPDLLGARDDPSAFVPRTPLLERAHRLHAGVRVPRTGRVLEALVPSVIEQKVTGKEAFRAFRWLVLRHGDPAPGPAPEGMRCPPTVEQWRRVPSWDWHRAGVDPKRMRTVMAALPLAARLEECCGMEPAEAERRLRAVPGVGVWTAAEVAQRALGDVDAVSYGDYHLAAQIGWALVGRPVDDDTMLELLEPWRPQRYRAVRLLLLCGPGKPRFGPRMTIQDHRRH